MFLSVMSALLLVSALSLDAFAASFAFGVEKIKVPLMSVLIINFICSTILAISLFFGAMLRPYISDSTALAVSFSLLLILGVIRLFDSVIKTIIQKYSLSEKDIKFKFLDFHFILRIYADSVEADANHSKTLSSTEAATLAVALSLDSVATGFGTGITNVSHLQIVLFSLVLGIIAVLFGCFLGRKVATKANADRSWISGVLLIILAFSKVLFQKC